MSTRTLAPPVHRRRLLLASVLAFCTAVTLAGQTVVKPPSN